MRERPPRRGSPAPRSSWPGPICTPPAWRGTTRRHASGPNWPTVKEAPTLVTLFEIHFDGWGVPKDFKKAAEYAERGEAAGNRRAIFYRGILYWNGDYYPKDGTRPCPSSSGPANWARRTGGSGRAITIVGSTGAPWPTTAPPAFTARRPRTATPRPIAWATRKPGKSSSASLSTARRPTSGSGGRKKRGPRRRPRGEPCCRHLLRTAVLTSMLWRVVRGF